MNYSKVNRNLLRRYKKYLIDKRTIFQVKAIGSYWTHYIWTDKDQKDYENIEKKLKHLQRF